MITINPDNITREISRISAKVADALPLLNADHPAALPLIEALLALEELYLAIGDQKK